MKMVSETPLQCSRVLIPPRVSDKIFLSKGIFINSTILSKD